MRIGTSVTAQYSLQKHKIMISFPDLLVKEERGSETKAEVRAEKNQVVMGVPSVAHR